MNQRRANFTFDFELDPISAPAGNRQMSLMLEPEKERHRWYREQDWWPGERLQDRYARIVAERPEGLAVVDDRGRCVRANRNSKSDGLRVE